MIKKKMAVLNDMGEYLMTDFSLLGKLSLSTSKMYFLNGQNQKS